MKPDEPFADESTHDRTFTGDDRPMWTAPRITRFEVTRTLGGSGRRSDGVNSHAAYSA